MDTLDLTQLPRGAIGGGKERDCGNAEMEWKRAVERMGSQSLRRERQWRSVQRKKMKWGKILPRGIYRADGGINGRSRIVAADTRNVNGFDAFDAGLVTVNCARTRVWLENAHVAHGS